VTCQGNRLQAGDAGSVPVTGTSVAEVRLIVDEIERRVLELLAELRATASSWHRCAPAPNRLWVADLERHEAPIDRAVVKGHRRRPVAAGW
jgi:hypothetical protein